MARKGVMSDKINIGGVEAWFEAETGFICIVYPPGVTDEAMAMAGIKATRAYTAPLSSRGEAAFILVDHQLTTSATAAARKVYAMAAREEKGTRYVVSISTSFAIRAIGNVVMRALSLVQRDVIGAVAADEKAAREWLTEQRNAYLARQARHAAS